MKTRRGLIKK